MYRVNLRGLISLIIGVSKKKSHGHKIVEIGTIREI